MINIFVLLKYNNDPKLNKIITFFAINLINLFHIIPFLLFPLIFKFSIFFEQFMIFLFIIIINNTIGFSFILFEYLNLDGYQHL
jgi:hypothetical protein